MTVQFSACFCGSSFWEKPHFRSKLIAFLRHWASKVFSCLSQKHSSFCSKCANVMFWLLVSQSVTYQDKSLERGRLGVEMRQDEERRIGKIDKTHVSPPGSVPSSLVGRVSATASAHSCHHLTASAYKINALTHRQSLTTLCFHHYSSFPLRSLCVFLTVATTMWNNSMNSQSTDFTPHFKTA